MTQFTKEELAAAVAELRRLEEQALQESLEREAAAFAAATSQPVESAPN